MFNILVNFYLKMVSQRPDPRSLARVIKLTSLIFWGDAELRQACTETMCIHMDMDMDIVMEAP